MQGYGRHSRNDVNRLLHDDLEALSAQLGDKPYLLGDGPCEADAAVFGILDIIVSGRVVSPEINEIVQQYPNLCEYTRRIQDRYFPEGPLVNSLGPSTKAD